MPLRTLLPLGVLLTVVLLLAVRVSQLNARISELEDTLQGQESQTGACRQLLSRSISTLKPLDPQASAQLERQQRVLERGDLRLLDPASYPELQRIVDDLL